MKSGINNCQLIEDYYNSDPGSLGMALEFLKVAKRQKDNPYPVGFCSERKG